MSKIFFALEVVLAALFLEASGQRLAYSRLNKARSVIGQFACYCSLCRFLFQLILSAAD
uniref:Uncharacterized protein n=1 Tax=Anguilla anguilla TaxID=7936 RepID=A0A0E9WYB9_ANGAN